MRVLLQNRHQRPELALAQHICFVRVKNCLLQVFGDIDSPKQHALLIVKVSLCRSRGLQLSNELSNEEVSTHDTSGTVLVDVAVIWDIRNTTPFML